MNRYSEAIKTEAKKLRRQGKTYLEINSIFKTTIPKSTLREWFKFVPLPKDYHQKIVDLNIKHLKKVRNIAIQSNKIKRERLLNSLNLINLPIANKILNKNTAKIALAMLCIGEASKYRSGSPFYLGSSSPKIIILFINLLNSLFNTNLNKYRCTVQCRADQNTDALEEYWQRITKIPKEYFYETRVDPRTEGKPTKKSDYHGVLKVEYHDTKIQLELESLADLVYNNVAEQSKISFGPVVHR